VANKDNPPDGWSVANGVWGTDFDWNTTVTNLSDGGCVEFKATTPASAPYLVNTDFVPVTEGRPYRFSAVIRAASVAAGNTMLVRARWYQADESILSTSDVWATAVLPAANTWYRMSATFEAPTSARFALIQIVKANTAFAAYLDEAEIQEMPVAFDVYRTAALNIANNSATKVPFDAAGDYNFGSTYTGAATYRFDAPDDGIYSFSSAVEITTTTGTNYTALIDFYKNGAIWRRGIRQIVPTSGGLQVSGTTTGYLSRGDYVEVYVYQNSGAVAAVTTGAIYNNFNGARVE
jgi:hypothetical protein